MIFGELKIEHGAVHTHNDSYALDTISVVSARRPLLGASILLGAAVTGFTLAFSDLLTLAEWVASIGIVSIMLGVGFYLGQIQLLSRDLRGSDLSCAVWGSYHHLNEKRREIAVVLQSGANQSSAGNAGVSS